VLREIWPLRSWKCRRRSFSGVSAKELDEAGIGDGLVRVSVGIEYWRDVLADFEQALERVK